MADAEKVERSAYDRLPKRLKRFVDGLVLGKTGTEAAREAGCKAIDPKNWAYRMRRRSEWSADIESAIAERETEAVQEAGRSASEVLRIVGETMDRCRQSAPVLDKQGHQVYVETPDGSSLAPLYAFDPKNVLEAAKLLGNYHKLWTQKHELTGKDGGPIKTKSVGNADDLTDEELEAIARTGRAAPAEPEEGED